MFQKAFLQGLRKILNAFGNQVNVVLASKCVHKHIIKIFQYTVL